MVNGSDNSTQLLQQVTAVYLGLLAVMGTAGNSLVVVTVLRMPQTHRLTYILVGNISIIGLLHCLLTIPLHVTHMLLGHSLWAGPHAALCKVQAHVNFALVLCTLSNSAAIAVCRYRTVASSHSVSTQTESRARILKLLLSFWAVPLLLALSAVPFLGYNPLLGDCFFLHSDSSLWYTTLGLAAPALLSTVCMLAAYTLIVKKVRDSRVKIANLCKKLGVTAADNMGNASKEERTVSESEGVPGKTGREARGESEEAASTMAGIRVYTTMVSDDVTIHVASTSQPAAGQLIVPDNCLSDNQSEIPDNCLSENQGEVPDNYLSDNQSQVVAPGGDGEGEGDVPRSLCPPRSSQIRQCPGVGVGVIVTAGLSATKGSTCTGSMLSVPSRAVSSLSGKSEDSVNGTLRNESGSSLSSWSSQTTVQTEREDRGRRRLRREVKLSLHLFLAFVMFCLLYLPLCLVHQLHALLSVSKDVWLAFYTLALSFASNAWLIYALLNKDFRRAFRALFRGRRSF